MTKKHTKRGGSISKLNYATKPLKGEAKAFELHTMREIDDKPWMGIKPDHRRMNELLDTWLSIHGHTLKSGKQARDIILKQLKD